MRTEPEVLKQILDFARADIRIRAVWLNGSRVNPNGDKDIFCDYDIVYAVTDPHDFTRDQSWIRMFGDLIILQHNDGSEEGVSGSIFLMIFSDGVRIDLSFIDIKDHQKALDDSLTLVLLDKDGVLPELPPPSENGYFPRPPDRKEWDDLTNEFWWCATYIAKGLWRGQLCYAKHMEEIVRDCLIKMLDWYIGVNTNWQVNPGGYGKWFNRFLPPEIMASLEKAYPGADPDQTWDALFEMGRLFRRVGDEVAENLGYTYPVGDDERVTAFLQRVRALPKDAQSI